MKEVIIWLLQNPWLIFMTIPGLFVCIVFSFWNACRKQKKLEKNPSMMTDEEYKRFNNKRVRAINNG